MGSVGCRYTVPSSVHGECSEGTSWLGLTTSSHGHRLQEHYDVLGLIDQGGFAAYIVSEVGILKDLQHPNITQLLEVIETKDKVHLVLDYVMGWWFTATIGALYMGDLKLKNVMINTQGHAKVCDFGLGFQFLPGLEVTVVGGTVAYCAPETISCQRYEGPPLDVWALRVILYKVVTGYRLFYGDKSQIIENIPHGTVSHPNFISKNAKHLIGKLLNHDTANSTEGAEAPVAPECPAPSPPEPLPVPTKRAILSHMARMGFDLLTVMDTLRRKEYNHEMATFLLLQSPALQGLGFSNPVKPVREAAEKTSWPLAGPAPLSHIPRRRASEPAPALAA
ncbi:sperm motility kinase 2A-like [Fukomys damarensis]|uniref:sperm motility kinase 2A-like n=1 Tax=Fukomys damarensis TaxID=885580 RepID=UPI0014553C54|nr:sperm motility kinase 2A-like [Fukomys damarensis]